jgi:putative glutamine amidotransferase
MAEADPAQNEMVLGMVYARAVQRAGGMPVVLPPLAPQEVPELVGRLEGLCLSGGPDLDPEAYDARAHTELGPVEPDLDRWEIALIRQAEAQGLPILGICRGAQALNVARGGTLHQHLPDVTDGEIAHRQEVTGSLPTHTADIAPGSLLAAIIGATRAEVNSFHHQAADRIGSGLRPVAWSPDGVIEGLEDPERPFVLGVQWHAETLFDRPEHARLFEALIEAASADESRRAA